MAKRTWKQGWYTLKNPQKYIGDKNKVRYMSSWELETHSFLDNNPNILQWASEEIAIPYVKPTDKRIHQYYPDYWVKARARNGKIIQKIIEVKPHKQTRRTKSRNKKQRLYEDIQLAINIAKWDAAKKFCNKYGIIFEIVTEKDIFS
jgi:hypothetical protein